MKKLKKTLSFGIVFALLLSMLTMPQHASAAFNTISENFDSWESLSDADGDKWITSQTSGIEGANLTAVEGHGNVLEITSDKQISFWVGDAGNTDTNSYKLSFSFKSNGGALYTWLAPWRNNADTNPSVVGTTSFFKASGATAEKVGDAWLMIDRNDVSDLKGLSAQLYVGAYNVEDWFNVEGILDYETRLVKLNYMDADGNLLGTHTKPMDDEAYAHRFVMSNWGDWLGSIYVDDIKIEETSESVTVLTDENFEAATGWSGVGGVRWRHFTTYRSEELLGNENVVVDTERNGEATKALTTCGNANKLDWWAGGAITEGTWKLDYKLYLTGYLDSLFIGLADSSAESCGRAARQQVMGMTWESGVFYDYDGISTTDAADRKLTGFTVGSSMPRDNTIMEPEKQTWYDCEIIVDLDNKVAHLTISRDGKVVSAQKDYSLVGSPIENGFDRLGFYTWSGTAFYIDDLKVERLLDYKPTVEDYIISEEDFENMTDADLAKNGWKFTRTDNVGTIENGALKLTASETNVEKWITSSSNNTKIKVKYDILAGGSAFADLIGNGVTHSGWYWTGAPLSAFVHSNGVFAYQTDGSFSHNKISDKPANKWITIENVVTYNTDKTLNTITTTVRDTETGELLTAGEKGNPMTMPLYNRIADWGTISNINLKAIRFISWTNEPVYIDNVVVSKYYDEPAIGDVTLTDASGSVATDMANVSTALKTVTLDFGAEMDEASALANISITDESGNTVEFIGEAVDKSYVLTLTDVLSAETDYTIKVNKEIASTLGVTLGKNFEYTFTTAKADCTVAKAELHNASGVLANITGLETGATVTVKSAGYNTYAENKSAVILVGYYNGNRLVNVSLQSVTLTAGKITNISENFILPDMTDVTDVDVFIWDSTTGMKPYCDVLSLSK